MDMETTTSTTNGDGTTGMTGGDPREVGTALLREGRFAEAATMLRNAVAYDATDEGSWRMLGAALAQSNDHAGAVEAFQQAANLSPLAAKSHYNLGLALQGAGRMGEARASLEKALALDPGYEQAKQRLMEISAPPAPSSVGLGTIGAAPSPELGQPLPPPPSMPLGPPPVVSSYGVANSGGGLSSVGGSTYAPPPPVTPVSPASLDTPAYNAPPALRPAQSGSLGDYAPPPMLGMRYGDTANTSGMQGDVPPEVARGFNWGAFGLTWIWLINMGKKGWGWGYFASGWAINALTYGLGKNSAASNVLSILYVLGSLAFCITMGVVGNKIAWQNRRFDSVEDFKACQRTWGFWVLGFVLFYVGIIFLAILLPVLAVARR